MEQYRHSLVPVDISVHAAGLSVVMSLLTFISSLKFTTYMYTMVLRSDFEFKTNCECTGIRSTTCSQICCRTTLRKYLSVPNYVQIISQKEKHQDLTR